MMKQYKVAIFTSMEVVSKRGKYKFSSARVSKNRRVVPCEQPI